MQITDVNIYSVEDTKSQDFHLALNIYSDSFPKNECRPIEKTIKMLSHNYRLYVANGADSVVGMALVYFWDDGVSLLDYMAVRSDRRGSGVGTKIFRHISKQVEDTMYLEVQKDPDRKDHQKTARINFYKRLGCRIVTDRYILPSYDGSEPEEVNLMVWTPNGVSLTGDRLLEVMERIHGDVYGYHKKDLLEIISSHIPEKVTA